MRRRDLFLLIFFYFIVSFSGAIYVLFFCTGGPALG